MIVKTRQGYQVRSESGRNLSKPNLSRAQAEARLAQVERFKDKSRGSSPSGKGRPAHPREAKPPRPKGKIPLGFLKHRIKQTLQRQHRKPPSKRPSVQPVNELGI
jgi:hypothetical protein